MNASPQKILIRGVNWLGDAVMSTPALLRLRQAYPKAHVAILTPDKLRDLWPGHPAVNETITFSPGEGIFSIARRVRAGNFDTALVLPNSPRSALEVWLAGVPRRIGYARPWRNWFLTDVVPPRPGHVAMHKRSVKEIRDLIRSPKAKIPLPPGAHQMHEYLHLASAMGANPEPLAPSLQVSQEELKIAAEKFGLTGIIGAGRMLFGVNPGAEYGPAKRWPVERFIVAMQQIQERTNCLWVVFGGGGDTKLAAEIELNIEHRTPTSHERVSNINNLAGRTSLRELCALFKLCRVVLTNDTGPMHLAAAVGTPVVVPFGSTSPELTGPGLPGDTRHKLLRVETPCAPCFLRECPIDFRCMKDIGVETVMDAVLQAVR